jgi:hypothetical protein
LEDEFTLFTFIKKYKVPILWCLGVIIFLVCAIVAQFKPFTYKGSGIIGFFSLNSILLAMTFSAKEKGYKTRMIFYIGLMIYFTYKTVLRLI